MQITLGISFVRYMTVSCDCKTKRTIDIGRDRQRKAEIGRARKMTVR